MTAWVAQGRAPLWSELCESADADRIRRSALIAVVSSTEPSETTCRRCFKTLIDADKTDRVQRLAAPVNAQHPFSRQLMPVFPAWIAQVSSINRSAHLDRSEP